MGHKKSTVEGHRKALPIAYDLDARFSVVGRKGAVFMSGGKKDAVFVGGGLSVSLHSQA